MLLVRAGLSGGDGGPGATTGRAATTVVTTAPRTTTRPGGRARFYRVKSGDTLESIAAKHDTSVEALLELNPRVDPVALTVGQRIRVG